MVHYSAIENKKTIYHSKYSLTLSLHCSFAVVQDFYGKCEFLSK